MVGKVCSRLPSNVRLEASIHGSDEHADQKNGPHHSVAQGLHLLGVQARDTGFIGCLLLYATRSLTLSCHMGLQNVEVINCSSQADSGEVLIAAILAFIT